MPTPHKTYDLRAIMTQAWRIYRARPTWGGPKVFDRKEFGKVLSQVWQGAIARVREEARLAAMSEEEKLIEQYQRIEWETTCLENKDYWTQADKRQLDAWRREKEELEARLQRAGESELGTVARITMNEHLRRNLNALLDQREQKEAA